ncbi:polyprenyl synthetase family protein [Rhodosalinus sediminis]|uniref:polyprenyl synthetase family protein n=1 Tax=Rhodosalinus sediminis TaxID=1940533 RepID=UPI002352C5CF|nr:polyprenyl synthetase family protein [Rhodosalinus sediminis]
MSRHTTAVPDAVDRRMIELCGTGPVTEAVRYHLSTGGNRVRARLGLDAARALGLTQPVAEACACGPELLHNASLVHDDLQDRDAARRGHAAVWQRFGPAAAVSVGDVMISAAFASSACHPDPAKAIALLHDAITRTAGGQARDLMKPRLDLASYRELVAEKTGPLFALPVRLALAAADLEGDTDAVEIGDMLAFAYQVLDDLKDRDADLAADRVNICRVPEPGMRCVSQVHMVAREALHTVRVRARDLPGQAGTSFCNLADRLDSAMAEHANAA